MVTIYTDKAAVSEPANFYPLRWSGGAAVGEWNVILGFALPAFQPAVAAVRWDGAAFLFGEIVTLPSDVYATGQDAAIRGGAAILWPQIDTGAARNTMHVYTANTDGTVHHEQVDVPILSGYSVSASQLWGAYYGDMFVMFQSSGGATWRADKFRVEADGTITTVGTDTHSGAWNTPPVYGTQDGGTANPAGNVLLWPYWATGATFQTIAIDLEGDVFAPIVCTPMFYYGGDGMARWVTNDDLVVNRRIYPGNPHGRDLVTGGGGIRMLAGGANYDIDTWRWTGSDVDHVSLSPTPVSPQLAGRGVAAFYPMPYSETWLGQVDASNADGSESWKESYWPFSSAAAWSALLDTDSNATGPGIKPRMGPYLEVEPGLVLFAAFSSSDPNAVIMYRLTGGDITLPPTLHVPPLRLHPRSDGRGMSSAQRVWPRPPTGAYGRIGPGSLI